MTAVLTGCAALLTTALLHPAALGRQLLAVVAAVPVAPVTAVLRNRSAGAAGLRRRRHAGDNCDPRAGDAASGLDASLPLRARAQSLTTRILRRDAFFRIRKNHGHRTPGQPRTFRR
ncbi:hypothetical protein IWX65_002011 [Arthrobacter sp. CAN_A214]|uniref:hypothetical protein n=1 Tax=Arthrobacter sp. CAN_A214 TaxID=2787720 RepID=UPI0018CB9C28